MPTQQALSFNDLPALNSSPAAVRQKFNDLYKKNPDGISVNDETYFNAVTPAITQQYGHPCYKTLGEFNYVEAASKPPSDAIVGSNYATNDSDEEATITVTVEGAWSQTQSWSSETTTGLSFTEEFTLEGVFKVGTTFNVSTTVGQSKSNTVSKTASASVRAGPLQEADYNGGHHAAGDAELHGSDFGAGHVWSELPRSGERPLFLVQRCRATAADDFRPDQRQHFQHVGAARANDGRQGRARCGVGCFFKEIAIAEGCGGNCFRRTFEHGAAQLG